MHLSQGSKQAQLHTTDWSERIFTIIITSVTLDLWYGVQSELQATTLTNKYTNRYIFTLLMTKNWIINVNIYPEKNKKNKMLFFIFNIPESSFSPWTCEVSTKFSLEGLEGLNALYLIIIKTSVRTV